jgi:hypothetical protein
MRLTEVVSLAYAVGDRRAKERETDITATAACNRCKNYGAL